MMNGGSLSEARTRVIKKVVFLFVLALVALAYVATPVLACGGGKGGKGVKGGNGNSGGNGIAAATDQQALADLKVGLKETFTDSSGATLTTLSSLKPGDTFKITFTNDGIVLDAVVDPSGLTATVTLPSGNQQKGVQLLNGKVILSNAPLSTTQSDKQTITQLQRGARLGLQLFKTNGKPLKLSSLQKVGQKFKIKIRGTLLGAVYLGNNQARVTLLSGRKITIPLGQPSVA